MKKMLSGEVATPIVIMVIAVVALLVVLFGYHEVTNPHHFVSEQEAAKMGPTWMRNSSTMHPRTIVNPGSPVSQPPVNPATSR